MKNNVTKHILSWFFLVLIQNTTSLAKDTSCNLEKEGDYALSLLGFGVNNKVLAEELICLGKAELYYYDDAYFYTYKMKGIILRFHSEENYLESVFFEAPKPYGNEPSYKGNLPGGIFFDLSSPEIRALMGFPIKERISRPKGEDAWLFGEAYSYSKSTEISIRYKENGSLEHLGIYIRRKEK